MGDNLRDELRQGGRTVVTAAIGAGVAAFVAWVKTRPIKSAIARRRARREAYAQTGPQRCHRPPPGWYCTRQQGHEGPCAARPLSEPK